MVPATVADGYGMVQPPGEFQMKKQKFKYIGDAAFKRFLERCDCPKEFHEETGAVTRHGG